MDKNVYDLGSAKTHLRLFETFTYVSKKKRKKKVFLQYTQLVRYLTSVIKHDV